jgi:outer membrane protein insertion porin family
MPARARSTSTSAGQGDVHQRIDIGNAPSTGDPPGAHREGDAFNSREIRDAEDRINGLGYFKEATVNVRPGTTEDQALVEVMVEEQPTGSLSLGGAFSSSEGISAQSQPDRRGFLGRGRPSTAAVTGGSQFANYELGFTEPALFDRDLRGFPSSTGRTTSTNSRSRPPPSASSPASASREAERPA